MCFQVLKIDFDSSRQPHRNNKLIRVWKRKGRRNVPRNTGASMSRKVALWPISKEAGFYECSTSQKSSLTHMYDLSQHADDHQLFRWWYNKLLKWLFGVMMESITKQLDTPRFCCKGQACNLSFSKIAQGYDQLDACLWHPSLRTRRMRRTIQPFRCAFLGQSWNCWGLPWHKSCSTMEFCSCHFHFTFISHEPDLNAT